jgi:hypothetical protein
MSSKDTARQKTLLGFFKKAPVTNSNTGLALENNPLTTAPPKPSLEVEHASTSDATLFSDGAKSSHFNRAAAEAIDDDSDDDRDGGVLVKVWHKAIHNHDPPRFLAGRQTKNRPG